MFNFFEFLADVFSFNSKDDTVIGLKRIQDVQLKKEKPKRESIKKEYKISELMKKTV